MWIYLEGVQLVFAFPLHIVPVLSIQIMSELTLPAIHQLHCLMSECQLPLGTKE